MGDVTGCRIIVVYTLREGEASEHNRAARIKLVDVAYNTILKIESGENQNPTIETVQKIAKALNASLDKLLK